VKKLSQFFHRKCRKKKRKNMKDVQQGVLNQSRLKEKAPKPCDVLQRFFSKLDESMKLPEVNVRGQYFEKTI